MDIVTLNVGQGAFAIVRHGSDAVIVDSYIPPSGDDAVTYVKGMLAAFLKNYFVRGLILTGFDEDHSDVSGVGMVLKKYRPDWVMYPKYFKDTETAKKVFQIIDQQEKERKKTPGPLLKESLFASI